MATRKPTLLSGATGLVGSAICRALADRGDPVRALTRSPQRSTPLFDRPEVTPTGWDGKQPSAAALSGTHALIHLAGEPIFRAGPVTQAHLDRVWSSRVESTRAFVDAIEHLPAAERPAHFICASAVGYYGDSGDEILDESHPPGRGFTSRLCERWESEAARAEEFGVRVVSLRIGVVFARSGGPLPLMSIPFRFGLGGRLGSGKQWFPWIEHGDLVALALHALDSDWHGAVNAVAPEPLRNADLTRALGSALSRPTLLPVPAFALRLALGELSDELLGSRRVIPQRAQEAGFSFRCERIEDALALHLV